MSNIKVLNRISKEQLINLYEKQHLSTRQIAKLYNCNASTIGDLLNRYGIPPRPVGGGKKVQVIQIEKNGTLVKAKQCTSCKEIKPFEEFNLCKKSTGGRQPKCKECRRKYYLENHEQIKYKSSMYYFKNHESNKIKRKLYYLKNKTKIRMKQKELYYLTQEKNILANRKYYQLNKDAILKRGRERRLEKLEYFRKLDRKRYINRKEQRAIYHKKYYVQNKDKIKLSVKKRKNFINKLQFTLTKEQWTKIQGDFNYGCALSEYSSKLNMEHFIPVSWGQGGTYMGNVYPVHWKINRSKSDMNPFVWIERDDVKEFVDIEKWHQLIYYLAEQNKLTISEFRDFVYWCENNKRDGKSKSNHSSIEEWKSFYYSKKDSR